MNTAESIKNTAMTAAANSAASVKDERRKTISKGNEAFYPLPPETLDNNPDRDRILKRISMEREEAFNNE